MVSEARKVKRREHAKLRRDRQANSPNVLRRRSGAKHVCDIARVVHKYNQLKQQGLLTECLGCKMDAIILPNVKSKIPVCDKCNRELCQLCGARSKCSLCNLEGIKFVSNPRALDVENLLLPCVNFDHTTRDHNKGCRRAIPAKDYYGHIAGCSIIIAELNNPTGPPHLIPEIPIQQEATTADSGEEESWDNDNPAPPRNMFQAIEDGMQNPDLDFAVPSWAAPIVYGNRNARRRRRRLRQTFRRS